MEGTELNKDQVLNMIKKRIAEFDTQSAYASHVGELPTVISAVLHNRVGPSNRMLADIGFVRKRKVVTVVEVSYCPVA